MDLIKKLKHKDSEWYFVFIYLIFIVLFAFLSFISNYIFKILTARAKRSKSTIDDFIIRLFKDPSIRQIYTILLNKFSSMLNKRTQLYEITQKLGQVLLIFAIGWLVIQTIRALFHYFQKKLDVDQPDNLSARSRLTRLNMLEKVLLVAVIVVFLSIALMTFETFKGLGVSLLASAGVMGIVVGLAAQRSVGQIFSGAQIAITQPIRLDDVVVIEGEWGRIEEINITYVVVRIWDERRLIVPIDYFLNNPIQSWTRTSSNILGTVFLYVAYS